MKPRIIPSTSASPASATGYSAPPPVMPEPILAPPSLPIAGPTQLKQQSPRPHDQDSFSSKIASAIANLATPLAAAPVAQSWTEAPVSGPATTMLQPVAPQAPVAQSPTEPPVSGPATTMLQPVAPQYPMRSTPAAAANTKRQSGRNFAVVTLLSTSRERRRYIGYLSGILVADRALKESKSSADFWVMIVSSVGQEKLPPNDESLLQRNNVKYKYIKPPWNVVDGVGGVMLAKIYCWTLVEYKRVLYIDSDIFPTSSMDVYFQLPRTTGFAGGRSPLNGGWFLLTPSLDVFEGFKKLIETRGDLEPGDKPPPTWDPEVGWGSPLDLYWKTGGKVPTGKGWYFNAAWSDQGLLYYYFRFLAELDIIYRPEKQSPKRLTYKAGPLVEESKLEDFPILFEHFAGALKPWNICPQSSERGIEAELNKALPPEKRSPGKTHGFWVWHQLYLQLDTDLGLGKLVEVMTPQKRCR